MQLTLVIFAIENHITHFFVTFMTMLRLLGFSFLKWSDFSHYFHPKRSPYGPLVAKVTKKW